MIPLPQPVERGLILERRAGVEWETRGVTNPGIIRLPDDTIAMMYRACSTADLGYMGFCRLDRNGERVIAGTRSDRPLNRRDPRELREFPDGCGDPRISIVGNYYYIWANGRDNAQMIRNRAAHGNDFTHQYVGGRQTVAFRTRDFAQLEYLGLHGPAEFDKNSFLHPEAVAIDGSCYHPFFHRIGYSVQVLLVRTIADLARRDIWRRHVSKLEDFALFRPEFSWEGIAQQSDWPGSVGGGNPPLPMPTGSLPRALDHRRRYWLMFYNAAGQPRDGRIARDRRVGAVLLTLKDRLTLASQPFEIVARAPEPVLLPAAPYEFGGPNGDVVFATGAALTLDLKAVDLFFGSGDVAISKARFDLRQLLDYLCEFDGHGKPHGREAERHEHAAG